MLPDRLKFHLARWRGDDAALAGWSGDPGDLARECRGGVVALVGNARALSQGGQGAMIDSADIVVRLNRAPMIAAHSHGCRTDWLAMSIRPLRETVTRTDPARLLWMTAKRKNLPYRLARDPRFHLAEATLSARMKQVLGASPSTGVMTLALLAALPARAIHVHGFDFFASRSLSGHRGAHQVPHDFRAEASWVHALCLMDPRVTLIRPDGQEIRHQPVAAPDPSPPYRWSANASRTRA
ncbi:glycosyltransferase family 29 protein [Thalassovita sp.]|uniref:glycosyltransferase family 29 protein n=1 Tax=Thalassovita sp. TaxID=1979401 RepID=UPI0029DE64B7|nr:glycosyltransferase family 29 protein [Thalassovita sp.]